jgi:hypothetical protein
MYGKLTTLTALLTLAACEAEPALEALPGAASPAPATLQLTAPIAIAGQPVTLTVTGANPGTGVTFWLGRGFGPDTCPPALGGVCHNLAGPHNRLGVVTADAQGVATFTLTLSPALSEARRVVQAMAPGAPAEVSNARLIRVYPAGSVVQPGDDVDGDGVTVGGGDCDDGDALIHPGAIDTVGDRVDQNCDDLDGLDADRDRAASLGSGGVDCDDQQVRTWPGRVESCDLLDNNCDGVVDEGYPDTDGSGRLDCLEVALVVTWGWTSHDLPLWTCDNELPLARELIELEALFEGLGLGLVRVDEDEVAGVSASQLAPYRAVMLNNGGWADELRSGTVDALLSAGDKALMMVGDDLAFMADRTRLTTGRPELMALAHIGSYEHNGNLTFKGLGGVLVDPDHPIANGPWGGLSDFAYEGDFDHLTLTGTGEQVLFVKEQVGTPVVWVAEEADRRLAVVQPSLYNNNNCPVSDAGGLADVATLYENTVSWVLDLP